MGKEKPNPITWTTKRIKLKDLIEWEKNPVSISDREAKELAKSIDRYEHVIPYVAAAPPNGKKGLPLLDGHQRKLVEIQINKVSPNTLVDVRVPSRKLTEKERQEIVIRLRKNTGEFDFDKLANFFDVPDLLEWGFSEKELQGAGFEMGEPKDAEPQIDRAEELLKKWKVARGQLWEANGHRLLCGDSTSETDVKKLMGDDTADFAFTDPPYNVGIKYGKGTNDNQGKKEFVEWCRGWARFLPERHLLTVGIKRLCWWDDILSDPQWIIAWVKPNGQGQTGLGGTNKWDAILCYGVEQDHKTDMIELNNDYSEDIKAEGGHPAAKPVKLWQQVIDRFGGRTVYEPFSGSGTTIIACENIGRKCRAMELEPKYVAVTLERLYAIGLTPVLSDQ